MAASIRDLTPLVDQDHSVGQSLDLRQHMTGQDDGLGTPELPNQGPHLHDLERIQAIGRFIQDQQLGIMQQGLGQTHSLPEPLRALPDAPPEDLLQAGLDHGPLDRGLRLGPPQMEGMGSELKEILHPHVAVDRVVFRQVTDTPLHTQRGRGDGFAADFDRPGIGRQVTGEDLDGGRLAGAVGSEESQDGTGWDLEIDPAQGLDGAIGLLQSLDPDHRLGSQVGRRCVAFLRRHRPWRTRQGTPGSNHNEPGDR